jgi:hypothetical protein
MDDQRRVELLEDVAVPLEEQRQELLHVMRYNVNLYPVADAGGLDCLASRIQPDHLPQWQDVDPTQVIIRVGRRETIEMRSADGREEEWIGVSGNLLLQASVLDHGRSWITLLRASIKNLLARR